MTDATLRSTPRTRGMLPLTRHPLACSGRVEVGAPRDARGCRSGERGLARQLRDSPIGKRRRSGERGACPPLHARDSNGASSKSRTLRSHSLRPLSIPILRPKSSPCCLAGVPSTPPTPVSRTRAQTCLYRVHPDVVPHHVKVTLIADVSVKKTSHPERPGPANRSVCVARRP